MSRYFLPFVFALATAILGCQQSEERPDNLPALLPIVVTVIQDGAPLEGAFVRLVPVDAKMPWSCGATTDDQGKAAIKTIGKFAGAPEGDYKVAISKLELPEVAGNDLSNLNAKVDPTKSASTDLVDPKYSNPNTTTLKLRVEKETSQVEFDVGAAVHIKQQGPR